ncbi:Zn-ribbon-containing, possibly RNA-binding protein and truncated derivatives [invertebrate metagenome]|uniref:Zn-ribbon-containing, possibly RNA-binding protein and truncated derivatives n=1 Tax=invertebrate metagenome TaxID=1711999 RepID=A0A484H867_9ZZZZ
MLGSPRHGTVRTIGSIVTDIIGAIVDRYTLSEATLLTQWSIIVGQEIAAVCMPIRLTFYRGKHEEGILLLKVANGSFAIELQHRIGPLMERINAYFGRAVVGKIRLTQGVLPRPLPNLLLGIPEPTLLPPAEEAALAAKLAPIHNDALREAFICLGRNIFQNQNSRQRVLGNRSSQ